jgi:hypothetical protein
MDSENESKALRTEVSEKSGVSGRHVKRKSLEKTRKHSESNRTISKPNSSLMKDKESKSKTQPKP